MYQSRPPHVVSIGISLGISMDRPMDRFTCIYMGIPMDICISSSMAIFMDRSRDISTDIVMGTSISISIDLFMHISIDICTHISFYTPVAISKDICSIYATAYRGLQIQFKFYFPLGNGVDMLCAQQVAAITMTLASTIGTLSANNVWCPCAMNAFNILAEHLYMLHQWR